MIAEELFLAPEDLYRLGNSSDPKLAQVRSRDVTVVSVNGIIMVVANGKGVSLSTKERLEKSPMAGWVWKIEKSTAIPYGLKLINDRPGHYSIVPNRNMPLTEYASLLSLLAVKCQKLYKKEAA